jgi:sugar phosphate isomerase/epimerase
LAREQLVLKQHKLSLSEISTVGASFREDLAAYGAVGFDGIGIWEMKLGNDDADVEALRASGLRATNCVPLVPSILPNAVIEGPADVEERIESICRSVARFARYEPECVLVLTGSAALCVETTQTAPPRALVLEGLRRVAAAADAAGVRLGLEPIHASQRDALSLVTSIPEALDLLDEADLRQVGIMLDLWHVWDTPTVEDDLRAHVDRFTGVHISDWHADGRPERALPGTGVSRTRELLAILAEAGWSGTVDVEIFGAPDDPDSFWALPVEEAARRAYEAAAGVLPYARR